MLNPYAPAFRIARMSPSSGTCIVRSVANRSPDSHTFPAIVRECEKAARERAGKKLLTIESASLFGVPRDRALRVAAAIEALHTYSLVHDDLPCMDDDDLRRGRPTTHRQFDEATAQPHCEKPEKLKLIFALAKALGVDMADLGLNESGAPTP